MTDRIRTLLKELKSGEYRKLRQAPTAHPYGNFSDPLEQAKNFRLAMEYETPLLFTADRIGFHQSVQAVLVPVGGNATTDYAKVLRFGFDPLVAQLKENLACTTDPQKQRYGEAMLLSIETCFSAAEKYREYAAAQGVQELADALTHIPHKGARSFYEACVFLKLIIFCLRTAFVSHITIGRFDQYMLPFYQADRERGVSKEELFEILEEFFLALNFDTDVYQGLQPGDNGQSMVLGGFDKDGGSMYNELSDLCMDASLELALIDPKINLRVSKNTPLSLLEKATQLTKKGLGFPQYTNDDVVVPGLIRLGYDPEDAIDYALAACWEITIPGKGAELPNLRVLDLAAVVNETLHKHLCTCPTFSELMQHVYAAVRHDCARLMGEALRLIQRPMPLYSVFFDNCIEELADMYKCAKYLNFGCQQAGLSTAADSLAAVKKYVYDEQSITPEELLCAMKADFVGYDELRYRLLHAPKMGENDDFVDDIAAALLDMHRSNMQGVPTGFGGIWRVGTGSAQYYIEKSERVPASADGRKAGAPYASSFSPAPGVTPTGLLSVIHSFTKYDLTNAINGGPLTVELHDTVLRNDIGIQKTAALIYEFIRRGGHQLQLNTLNKETLLDAQANPENYPDLVVRVWGWSGYFRELDPRFQQHIINRTAYM